MRRYCVVVVVDNKIEGESERDRETKIIGLGTERRSLEDFVELIVSPLIIQVIWFDGRLHSGHDTHHYTDDNSFMDDELRSFVQCYATLSDWNWSCGRFDGSTEKMVSPRRRPFISVWDDDPMYALQNNVVPIQMTNGSIIAKLQRKQARTAYACSHWTTKHPPLHCR